MLIRSPTPPPSFLTHPIFNNTSILRHFAIFRDFGDFEIIGLCVLFCSFFFSLVLGWGYAPGLLQGWCRCDSKVEFLHPHEVIPVLRCTRPTTNRTMSQDTLISYDQINSNKVNDSRKSMPDTYVGPRKKYLHWYT